MADSGKYGSRSIRSKGYLPTLDGWRTISILSVILFHDGIHTLGPFSTQWFYLHGYVGVDIFFSISGLLICSKLFSEERTKVAINVRSFYVRRAFRILPPAVAFLAFLLLLAHTIHLEVGLPEVIASLCFMRNYTFTFTHFQSIYPGYTSHFWSLAVEEHFYLILPALLVISKRRWWRVPALFAIALAVSINRVTHGANEHTGTRIDALFFAAAIAILIQNPVLRTWLTRWLWLWPLVAGFILVLVNRAESTHLPGLALAWLLPFVILGTMLRPQSWFSRFLELAPMRYVGRLSYSLYLWQQLFFITHFDAGGRVSGPLSRLQAWPYNALLVILFALFSYYLIEQPFIRLGRKLLTPKVTDIGPQLEPQPLAQ
ncbi:MAG: acyltransferase [Granulicella sp.]